MDALAKEQTQQVDGTEDFGQGPLSDFMNSFLQDLSPAPDAASQSVTNNFQPSPNEFTVDPSDAVEPFHPAPVSSSAPLPETQVTMPNFTVDPIEQLFDPQAWSQMEQELRNEFDFPSNFPPQSDNTGFDPNLNWDTILESTTISVPMVNGEANTNQAVDNNAFNFNILPTSAGNSTEIVNGEAHANQIIDHNSFNLNTLPTFAGNLGQMVNSEVHANQVIDHTSLNYNSLPTSAGKLPEMSPTPYTPAHNAKGSAAAPGAPATSPQSARMALAALSDVTVEVPKTTQFIHYHPPGTPLKPATRRKTSPRTMAALRGPSKSSPLKPTTPNDQTLQASPVVNMRASAPAKMSNPGNLNMNFIHFSPNGMPAQQQQYQQQAHKGVATFQSPAPGRVERSVSSEMIPTMAPNPRKRKISETSPSSSMNAATQASGDDVFTSSSSPPASKKPRRGLFNSPGNNPGVTPQEQHRTRLEVLFRPHAGAPSGVPRPSLVSHFSDSNVNHFRWRDRHVTDPSPPPSRVCRQTGFDFPIPMPTGVLVARGPDEDGDDDEDSVPPPAAAPAAAPATASRNIAQSTMSIQNMLNGQQIHSQSTMLMNNGNIGQSQGTMMGNATGNPYFMAAPHSHQQGFVNAANMGAMGMAMPPPPQPRRPAPSAPVQGATPDFMDQWICEPPTNDEAPAPAYNGNSTANNGNGGWESAMNEGREFDPLEWGV